MCVACVRGVQMISLWEMCGVACVDRVCVCVCCGHGPHSAQSAVSVCCACDDREMRRRWRRWRWRWRECCHRHHHHVAWVDWQFCIDWGSGGFRLCMDMC